MDLNLIRSNLGRVKIYYLKNESDRALTAAITALKEIAKGSSSLPADIKTSLREAVYYFMKDEAVKGYLPVNFIYQAGSEKQILASLVNCYKQLNEAKNFESRANTLARKNLLDQNINNGTKLLAAGKISEADQYFSEAVKYYKDEHRIFQLIGSSLLSANQYKRAFPYLKKGLEAEPQNQIIKNLLLEVKRMRNNEKSSSLGDLNIES